MRSIAEAGSLIGAFILFAEGAAAQSACDTIPFAAGTEWTLCWEMRQREGLVIQGADYKDKGGVSNRVLTRGSIAEVHVPYHPGTPRFLDVTASTAGLGAGAVTLAGSECDGVLVDPQVCREIEDRGYAWKTGQFFQKGQEVTYWISSQLGQYNYITSWTFRDDGSFEAGVGLTGRLQIFGTGAGYRRFGSRLNRQADSPAEFGINHMHNIYWRLDLDIAGALDDAVNRITQARHTGSSPSGVSCSVAGTCLVNLHARVTTELIERLAPFKSWHQLDRGILNADGRPVGYELMPSGNQRWTGPTSEPWAAGELFVTSYDPCELFAVNNNASINPGCGSAAPHVRAMVNAQPVDGADVVLWYNAHFEHVVRDEDQENMLIHHMSVELHPRSWRHVSTLE
jgi:primary-amine oxidase